ncbi:MAG: hypothetical protein ACI9VN_000201 [Patescibacteria group bacterium]|jgi:hypothetical protein
MMKFKIRELTHKERKKLKQELISNLIGAAFDGMGMVAFIVFILLIPLLVLDRYLPISSQNQLIYSV